MSRLMGMTGFGRAEGALGDWTWAVEARSVNGRNLEVRFRGPSGFDALERLTREAAQGRFQRGQLTVGVQARKADGGGAVRINTEQLERYLAAAAPYVATGLAAAPTMDGLLSLRGVIEAADGDEDPEAAAKVEKAMAVSIGEALDRLAEARAVEGSQLNGVLTGLIDRIATLVAAAEAEAAAKVEKAMAVSIGEALDRLVEARSVEGAQLDGVLSGLIDRIATLVAAAEAEAAAQPAIIKARFERRLQELAGEAATPERIIQEAAALALKADVREELDRLVGHVASARDHLASEGAVGRRLDFLTQEFMREANTLCSKAALPTLTTVGLDLKAVIEQFREQVQNVE